MSATRIYINRYDLPVFQGMLDATRTSTGLQKHYLKQLAETLDQAIAVEPQEMPRDVITLNSRVRLRDLDNDKDFIYTIVHPHAADIYAKKISILAPMGTAMLGNRVGYVITWEVPTGRKRCRIEEVLYQPEAAGDFHI